MICPAPTKKFSSTHWLDHLRSARGFPTTDGVDFDRFIAAVASDSSAGAAADNSKPSPESTRPQSTHPLPGTPTEPTAQPKIIESRDAQNDAQCADVEEEEETGVGHVLCELFVMGSEKQRRGGITGNLSKEKHRSSRKQPNPRFCDVWSKGTNNDIDCSLHDLGSRTRRETNKTHQNGLVSSGDNNHNNNNSLSNRRKGSKRIQINVEEFGLRENEEEKEEWGINNEYLRRYSMSQVTVIDSSIEGWKVERCVFRRKSVWKVGEKKSKTTNFDRKWKRRLTGSNWGGRDNDNDNDVKKRRKKKVKKKKAVRRSDPGSGAILLKNRKREQISPTSIDKYWHDEVEKVPKEVASVPRLTTFNSSQNFRRPGSSVILVKAAPTFDNSGTKKPGRSIIRKG